MLSTTSVPASVRNTRRCALAVDDEHVLGQTVVAEVGEAVVGVAGEQRGGDEHDDSEST